MTSAPPSAPGNTGMQQTILSVDDEPELLKCFQDALQFRGYRVLTTTNPDEGVRLARETAGLALLLLDIKMPGKNGFEVYREIRAFRPLPVLFITAYPRSFTRDSDDVSDLWQKEFADGTTDILYKPFELTTLFSKVAGLIGGPTEGAAACP